MFAACTLPGAVAGVLVADKVSRPGFDVILGVALTGLAWWLVRGRGRPHADHAGRGVPRTLVDRDGNGYQYHVNVRLGALLALGVRLVLSVVL